MYDKIINWTQISSSKYNINFKNSNFPNRSNTINNLNKQFDLDGLHPQSQMITLRGSKSVIKIVTHQFKHCLYSLLNDNNLMNQDNLLISTHNPYDNSHITQTSILDEINSGSVYRTAYKKYIIPGSLDILCPIIFFIDKTHTDTNGRWCLEQIRFTLGIFNRQTRNQPRAWRTLGYIADQQQIIAENPLQKGIDYHHMIEIILSDFKQCQQHKFKWELANNNNNQTKTVYFVIPVMFIVGDTDGHDKLAGRYTSRTKVARLCRYCDCPFDATDNPDFKFQYTTHKNMFIWVV